MNNSSHSSSNYYSLVNLQLSLWQSHSIHGSIRPTVIKIILMQQAPYSSVHTATRPCAACQFPAKTRNICLLQNVQSGSGAHPPFYPKGTRIAFPGAKAEGIWNLMCTPSSAEVTDVWNCAPNLCLMTSIWTENITSIVDYTLLLFGKWHCQTVKLST